MWVAWGVVDARNVRCIDRVSSVTRIVNRRTYTCSVACASVGMESCIHAVVEEDFASPVDDFVRMCR
jgi:hypothetical protein